MKLLSQEKILILYTSIGLGHKTIAENIGYHLENAGYNVVLKDAVEEQGGMAVKYFIKLHSFVNRKMPWLWQWVYTSKAFTNLTLPGRVKAASKNYKKILDIVKIENPDLVISTQVGPSSVMQYLFDSNLYNKKFAIAFSDYHLHRYWLFPSADLYFANIPEQKSEMVKLGIPQEKIAVVGITLKPPVKYDPTEIKQKLNIEAENKVVVIASGSLGIGGLSTEYIVSLAKHFESKNTDFVVVCGKNEQLKEQLLSLSNNQHNLKVFGYYSPINELYSITDLLVTKPGGMTMAETLQIKLPTLITHWLPGQELLNYFYLELNNLLISMPKNFTSDQLTSKIESFFGQRNLADSVIDNETRKFLVQEDMLGIALVKAVNELFHKV